MRIFKIISDSFKKIPLWVFIALILLSVGFVIYNSRQIFYFKYESEYYENLYYHSQWNIPNSTRGISDGLLYQFVGFRLVHGENPFYLNYETPPFGKYLYGLAEYYLNNPYWVSLFLYLGSIVIFYLLADSLFKDKKYALLSLLLYSTTPFIATQVRDTMLDLPLTAFYLTHSFFFVKFLHRPKILFLGLSGIFLGLATGTKIGVYSPWVIFLGLALVLWVNKSIGRILIYLASVFAGYCFAYISYFIHHPNPIPWVKLHQKQLEFYLNPGDSVDYLNQWKGIFLNTYQGWWGIEKISLGDWSPILPLGVLAAVSVLFLALKRKEKPWIYISGITLIFLIVNTFISFWPRYLMPAVPGFILLIAYFARKYWWVMIILSLLNLPFFVNSLAHKNYYSNSDAVGSFIAKRAYRELYRSIDPGQRKSIPEDQFIKTLENFYETLNVKKIGVKIKDIVQTGKNINVRYKIDYLTGYGKISFDPELEFKDVHNQTMLVWKWDYLWPKYDSDRKIIIGGDKIPIEMIRRGVRVVAKPGKGKAVYIITRHIEWPKTLDRLSEVVGGKSSLNIGDSIRNSIPDDFPRYVGVLDTSSDEDLEKKALDIKGVKLREFSFLVPEPDASKKDISQLIMKVYESQPELFYVNTDIYFESNGQKEFILKLDPENFGKILDI